MSTRIHSIQTRTRSNGEQATLVEYSMSNITTPEMREWLITGDNILHFAKLVNMSDAEAMLMKLDMSVNQQADIRPDVLYIIHDAMMRSGFEQKLDEMWSSFRIMLFVLDKNTPPDILRYFEQRLESTWDQEHKEEQDHLDRMYNQICGTKK